MKKILITGIGISLIVLTGVAGAGVVTSLPGGTVVPMPGINYFGPGPQVFGPPVLDGIQWTSTNFDPGSVFGYTGSYGFESNGTWDGVLGPMAGLNSPLGDPPVIDTMTFRVPHACVRRRGIHELLSGIWEPRDFGL